MSERVNNDNGEQMLGTDRCENSFGAEGVRRCDNCERFREERGLGDFVCRHGEGIKRPHHTLSDVLIVSVGDQIMRSLAIFGVNITSFTKQSGIEVKGGSIFVND